MNSLREQVGTLCIAPVLRAGRDSRGRVRLTRKFVDGLTALAERWLGEVDVFIEPAELDDTNLDHEPFSVDDLPFALTWRDPDRATHAVHLADMGLVMPSLEHELTHLADVGSRLRVPVVYISEYSLNTRKQVIAAETSNPILRLRRQWWTTQLERRFERAVDRAAGVQCNGTPTYDAYSSRNANAMLYFDSRTTTEMLARPEQIDARAEKLLGGHQLRLAFSGRLVAMKGVQHLPRFAARLRHMGLDFTLDICGGGPLEDELRQAIERQNLGKNVRLRGVLDFQRELIPFIRDEVDLFVCCHPQGDPSCTYLETMACGTPIVGFDNEAFVGIVRQSGVGWTTALGNPDALAEQVAQLNRQRDLLVEAAHASLAFARSHTFEQTMDRRVEHLLSCLQPAEPVA